MNIILCLNILEVEGIQCPVELAQGDECSEHLEQLAHACTMKKWQKKVKESIKC